MQKDLKNMEREKMKDYSQHKDIMVAIGIPLIAVGAIISIIGWTSFGRGSFDSAPTYGMMFIGGAFMAMIGFSLLRLAFIRPVSKYVATEASPAMKIAGQSIGEGLKESGIVSGGQSKEVVKIKCRNCGYLDTEDAEFCSKCGKKL